MRGLCGVFVCDEGGGGAEDVGRRQLDALWNQTFSLGLIDSYQNDAGKVGR